MTALRLEATAERWPLGQPFRISRGAKDAADVVVAHVTDGRYDGRGECVPYPRYGHSVESVLDEIRAFSGGLSRTELLTKMPAGPARNAIDCALWDLEAKASGIPAWQQAGVVKPVAVRTAFTITLDSAEAMGRQARAQSWRSLLKVKLGTDVGPDIARIKAVRAGATNSRIIVDANEGWDMQALRTFIPAAHAARIELIEQPLPADSDLGLAALGSPIPIAADESAVDGIGLAPLARRYQAINIKLDKTGGLTQALHLARAARELGLQVMVGCMVATSLAMAPALVLASFAKWIDLDGPLLLANDRKPSLEYNGDSVTFSRTVWG